jgi:undecaprenyl-diphosphatase
VFDKLIQFDKQFLIYLNNLGSEKWDNLWLFITHQTNWAPLFVLVLVIMFRYVGWKKGLFLLFFIAIMITFSDQFTNFIRVVFKRLRPNNDTEIQHLLRTLINPQSFSFTSGHATTSTLVTVFIIRLLKNEFKYIWAFMVFPIVFAYSRLYLGVHFPIDILTGALNGFIMGTLFYFLYKKIELKFF